MPNERLTHEFFAIVNTYCLSLILYSHYPLYEFAKTNILIKHRLDPKPALQIIIDQSNPYINCLMLM